LEVQKSGENKTGKSIKTPPARYVVGNGFSASLDKKITETPKKHTGDLNLDADEG